MDETEYRTAYHQINPQRCRFEKTVLARRAACQFAHRFNLGEREGVACQNHAAQQRCEQLLQQMRQRALFSLQLTRLQGQLPHAKEMKVQSGGLLGLRQLIQPQTPIETPIADINGLLEDALIRYQDFEHFPYDTLARCIVQFSSRPRRSPRG